jgi:hypothetical protein
MQQHTAQLAPARKTTYERSGKPRRARAAPTPQCPRASCCSYRKSKQVGPQDDTCPAQAGPTAREQPPPTPVARDDDARQTTGRILAARVFVDHAGFRSHSCNRNGRDPEACPALLLRLLDRSVHSHSFIHTKFKKGGR